jgi:hypothetical protein
MINTESKLHDENVKLGEILSNINVGLYQIQNIDNIRIVNNKKPDAIILCSEVEASNKIANFFNTNKLFENKSNIGFEGTFYDFYVVNIKSEKDLINGLTISLFELIISSQYLQIDEDSKWSLDDTNFKLYEVDYNEDEIEKNINETILDMKIMG